MIRAYCHRDPMAMTWRVFADHSRRILPYMVKLHLGKLTAADKEATDRPTLTPQTL